ncbi:MAG: CheR family methyltransferase [Sulfobacillus sp.]
MRLSEAVLEEARVGVATGLGLDFRTSQSSRLERALSAMLRTEGVPAAQAARYLQELWTLPKSSSEWNRLARHFTVGETYFFRDQACFDAIGQTVLPELVAKRRRQAAPKRLRIWCAGCATGEEPYSLAMLLDQLRIGAPEFSVEIVATDVNAAALETARRGEYREWSLRATPAVIRDRYFEKSGPGRYELSPAIRSRVTFQLHNLVDVSTPDPGDGFDLVLCRNVLMYFIPKVAQQIIERLQNQLTADGWLVTAPAEASAESYPQLTAVNFPGAILFRQGKLSHVHGPSVAARPGPPPEAELSKKMVPVHPVVQARIQTPVAHPVVPSPEISSAVSARLAEARILADAGRLADAQVVCEQVLAADVLLPEAHILLGVIHQERGEVDAAKSAFRRALYLDPAATAAHFLLGILFTQLGEPASARRSMETAVRLLGRSPPDQVVVWADGLTAGRLLETARGYLEADRSVRR